MSDAKKTQGEGILDKVKGKAKEMYGGATDDRSKEAEGKYDQAKGEAKQQAGEAQEKLEGTDEDRN